MIKRIANYSGMHRLINVVLRGSVLILKFIFMFFAAKFWSPKDLGLFGLVATIVMYGGYLIGVDFYVNTQRAIRSKNQFSKNVTLTHHLLVMLAAFLLIIPFVLYYFDELVPLHIAFFICLLLLIEQLNLEFCRMLVLKQKQLLVSSLLFVRHGAYSFVFILWAISGNTLNVNQVITLWLCFSLLCSVIGGYFFKKYVHHKVQSKLVNLVKLKKQIAIASVFFIGTLLLRGLFSLDKILVAEWVSLELLGIYTFYVGLAAAVIAIFDASVGVYLLPAIFKLKEDRNIAQINKVANSAFYQCLGIYIIAYTTFGVFGSLVISLIGNELYLDYKSIFLFVSISACLYSASNVYHNVIYVLGGYDKWLTYFSLIAFLIFLLFAYLQIEALGIKAILIGNNLAFLAFFSLKLLLAKYIIHNQSKV